MIDQPKPSSIFSLSNHDIFVITAAHDGKESGQIATWIMPATLVPDHPRIVAVISPQNYTHGLIDASGYFIVSLLSDEQYNLVPVFGLYSGRTTDKFHGLGMDRPVRGIPILKHTCGWALCRIVDRLDSGDRVIYLADIIEQNIHPNRIPLKKAEAFMLQLG